MLSTLYTLGIYVTGVFAPDIREAADFTKNPHVKIVLRAVYYLVPNFHNFNAIDFASHGLKIPLALVAQNTLYAVVYVSLVLLAASAVFARRNLK